MTTNVHYHIMTTAKEESLLSQLRLIATGRNVRLAGWWGWMDWVRRLRRGAGCRGCLGTSRLTPQLLLLSAASWDKFYALEIKVLNVIWMSSVSIFGKPLHLLVTCSLLDPQVLLQVHTPCLLQWLPQNYLCNAHFIWVGETYTTLCWQMWNRVGNIWGIHILY